MSSAKQSKADNKRTSRSRNLDKNNNDDKSDELTDVPILEKIQEPNPTTDPTDINKGKADDSIPSAAKPSSNPYKNNTPQVADNTLPQPKKPKLLSKPKLHNTKPPDQTCTRAVTVTGLRDGSTIADITLLNGEFAFTKPFFDYFRDDADNARRRHGVDAQLVARDPKSPTTVWKIVNYTRGREVTKLKEYLIHVPDGKEDDTFRSKWGKHIVMLHNQPRFLRHLFGTRNHAYFAGDLTPEGTEKPFMSQYLTIRHTIQMMQYTFSDKKIEDLLANDAIMGRFFPADMFDRVREFHTNSKKPSYDDGTNLDDDSKLPRFQP